MITVLVSSSASEESSFLIFGSYIAYSIGNTTVPQLFSMSEHKYVFSNFEL